MPGHQHTSKVAPPWWFSIPAWRCSPKFLPWQRTPSWPCEISSAAGLPFPEHDLAQSSLSGCGFLLYMISKNRTQTDDSVSKVYCTPIKWHTAQQLRLLLSRACIKRLASPTSLPVRLLVSDRLGPKSRTQATHAKEMAVFTVMAATGHWGRHK